MITDKELRTELFKEYRQKVDAFEEKSTLHTSRILLKTLLVKRMMLLMKIFYLV